MSGWRQTIRIAALALAACALSPSMFAQAEDSSGYHMTKAEAKEFFRSLDEILRFASERTGLPIRHEVKKKLASRQQVERQVAARMKEQGNGDRLDRMVLPLKKLGLLPRNFDLRSYTQQLYTEQVEPLFISHAEVNRAALIGLGPRGCQRARPHGVPGCHAGVGRRRQRGAPEEGAAVRQREGHQGGHGGAQRDDHGRHQARCRCARRGAGTGV